MKIYEILDINGKKVFNSVKENDRDKEFTLDDVPEHCLWAGNYLIYCSNKERIILY